MGAVAVMPESTEMESAAQKIATHLKIPLLSSHGQSADYPLILMVRSDGLALRPTDKSLGKELRIDFIQGPTAYRRLATGSSRQPLAKAIGIRQGCRSVVDATAGLGRDAFLMACLGCTVLAVERSEVLAMVLQNAVALARESKEARLAAISQRLKVVAGDSSRVLLELAESNRPDVVYLDPMYTPRESSALAKKEMRILRTLVGGDEDSRTLLGAAVKVSRKRVVVKRHLRAPALSDAVDLSVKGRTVRYDVYLTSSQGRKPFGANE